MSQTIAQRELRNDNAKVIDAVVGGETFVVTRNGVAVAELRPVVPGRRKFVLKADLLTLAAGSPHIDRAAFMADLDVIADQEL